MIIFLNGPSSSGKTSTALELQKRWPKPLIHMGSFAFMKMIDYKFIGKKNRDTELGFYFNKKRIGDNIQYTFHKGRYGLAIWKAAIESIGVFAQNNVDIIIEEVLTGKADFRPYLDILKDRKVYFIGLTCPIKTIRQREKIRADRIPGQAEGVYNKVHPKNRKYDIKIDTSKIDKVRCAKIILEYINKNKSPKSWDKLY
jgi:chloramphenicol 3-O phosphotransferase